ncbi:uncharacterized protein LOC141586120 [Silene latifolia]|uniref:uncharacterized protein LOC141586120 n=1 Tax=Silene latifolia TaxID=37657 RepID=UPI003D77CBC0
MSAEIEEQVTVVQPEDVSSIERSKKPSRSYTKEFLLSLSELEVCKKLPDGFDESLLSEFRDTSYGGPQDRPRALGSSPLQGFRRTDYGSSPPARGDSGTYSRGIQRWDSRSSGKSEGDSDSAQSESGRRYGNQGRRTWQNPEHDGLLGSGSLTRPPGYAAGSAVPRFRPTENLQLSKSNEPYNPPRPYKAGPYSRRETKDSFNDETFGSSDSNAEDRVEEEQKRRAEFELMRKEHHKAFQENQKLNPGKPKDSFSEMVEQMENTTDSKISNDLNKVSKEVPLFDASKLSVSSQAPPIRPLVPPGFVSSVVDKSSTLKSNVSAGALQVENSEIEHTHQNVKTSDGLGGMNSSSNLNTRNGLSSIFQDIEQSRSSSLPFVTDVVENVESLPIDSEISGLKMLGEPVRSTSILDTLFGNSLTTSSEGTSNILQDDDPKTDDIWNPEKLQSKFTSWFQEDKKPLETSSMEKPSSLLSLIIGGENDKNVGLNGVLAAPVSPPEIQVWQKTSNAGSSTGNINGPVPKASVLTCEDLEQSMLLEIGGDNSKTHSFEKDEVNFKKEGLPSTHVENSASLHLLSLLHGGTTSSTAVSTHDLAERLPDINQELGKSSLPESSTNSSGVRELSHSDRTLTLETLFGSAFMTELHSAHKNSVGSGQMDVPDGGLFPINSGQNGDGVSSHEGSTLASNDTGENVEFSRRPYESDAKFSGFNGGFGVKLPEEDTLINLADPINAGNSSWAPNSGSSNVDLWSLSSNSSGNVMEKLAVLGGAVKDERSIVGGHDPLLSHDPFNMRKPEIPYQNQHIHSSSPHLHTPPMNHNRTWLHPLDSHPSHLDPHMKFTPQDAVIHRDAPMHHQFPTNMDRQNLLPHSSAGFASFDHPIPPPVLQQMHMAGNHPPPHLIRGFPNAAPMAPHLSHTPAGFVQEHNPMHAFPFGQRQPNFGGPGMMPSGPELGVVNNRPDAFQRLAEMESREAPMPIHPFAAGNPSRAMYGREMDMGFRYT